MNASDFSERFFVREVVDEHTPEADGGAAQPVLGLLERDGEFESDFVERLPLNEAEIEERSLLLGQFFEGLSHHAAYLFDARDLLGAR